MEQVNAEIECDVSRLNFPRRPWYARQGHGFVARLLRVPADVTKVFARVFRANGAYFDVTGHEHRDGSWTVRIPAACFPEAGDFHYEIHGVSADDEPAAIGEGQLLVQPFSTTTTPLPIGTVQEVCQMPCEGGGYVQVVMKWDGYEWMQQAVHYATANDGTEEP